jgi:hypothetical protein
MNNSVLARVKNIQVTEGNVSEIFFIKAIKKQQVIGEDVSFQVPYPCLEM